MFNGRYHEQVFNESVTAKPERDLREELLAAARQMLATPQSVRVPSLRAIAKACGVVPSAVYWHFPSEAELRSAVLDAEYASLIDAVSAALDESEADDALALNVAGQAYIRWGLSHPGAYQLLFEGDDPVPETRAEAGPQVQDRIVSLARLVDGDAPFSTALLLWSLWHGIVSLRLHKPQWEWGMSPDEANSRMLGAFIAGAP